MGVDLELLRRLYDRLAAKGIRYALEPYHHAEGQIVRDPKSMLDDSWGTCLDIAVTYAAMCLASHVSPLLVVHDDHALVLGVTARRSGATAPELRGCVPDPRGELGVYEVRRPEELASSIAEDRLVPVDCVQTTTPGVGFQTAFERGCKLVRIGARVIDIAYIHAQPGTQLLSAETGRPGIRRHPASGLEVPGLLPTQTAVSRALTDMEGTVAVYGDSETGKSTIARALARDAPTGAVWFLDASSEAALRNSLAAAERAENNRTVHGIAEVDRGGYAAAALDRLRRSETPWVVVLDNADQDPGVIAPYQPRPGRGRLVLITTTNPAWEAVPDVRWLPLERLSQKDVEDAVGPELALFVDGRPLLLEAFQSLMSSFDLSGAEIAACRPATGQLPDELAGPATWWRALRRQLSPQEVRAATLAAYLPPDHVPLASIERLADLGDQGLASLLRTYVLTAEPGAAEGRMHRLLGGAVRGPVSSTERSELTAALIQDPSTRATLDEHADPDALSDLRAAVEELDEAATAPSIVVARVLHAFAATLELRGAVADSAVVYRRLLRHVEGDSDEARLMRADAFHGIARDVNQKRKRERTEAELREALEFACEARALRAAIEGADLAGRHRAIEGLLRQHLAAYVPRGGQRTAELLEAERIIREAHE